MLLPLPVITAGRPFSVPGFATTTEHTEPTYRHGRHEHDQNFLTDGSAIATITRLVAVTEGPIIEIGPGDEALTIPLAWLGRPVTAVEIDIRLARRRAGVGGAAMMTAQWAPWFEFALHSRVPVRAFTARPGVDGGLPTVLRREHPLLPPAQRRQFHALVHRVYTGPGRGFA